MIPKKISRKLTSNEVRDLVDEDLINLLGSLGVWSI